MAINHAALKTELQTDPVGYGYAPHIASGNDLALADMLNLVRTGSNGGPAITVRRSNIPVNEVIEAIDLRDFAATPQGVDNAANAGSLFSSMLQQSQGTLRLINDDGTDTRNLGNLKRLLKQSGDAGFQSSRDRVVAIANRQGSRAEQLFGPGAAVTHADIATALRG